MSAREEKRESVFDAAGDVFASYGFRRTSMNDIAKAASISRPALYLMFENKEDLFRQLAAYRQARAIDEAVHVLSGDGTLSERLIGAILAYEKLYYEPVSESPHGDELMDVNQSIAADDMKQGSGRLVQHLARALMDAEKEGEADFSKATVKPKAFVELLMASIGGVKKNVASIHEFRRRIREVGGIFMKSIAP